MRARPVARVGWSVFALAASAVAASSSRQTPAPPPTPSTTEFVAFRVDDERVIATLKVDDTVTPMRVDEDRLSQPAASFGYRYFKAPDAWRDRLPATVRPPTRWIVHAAPVQPFDAIPESIVGGAAGCSEAVGILMRVSPSQAFAASLWLRAAGDQALEIVETNLRPAQWLRMWEFQGKLEREQLGLVLNVLDRDGDGWGEVLSSLTGYEGMTIELREYSPTGFQPTNVSHSQGC